MCTYIMSYHTWIFLEPSRFDWARCVATTWCDFLGWETYTCWNPIASTWNTIQSPSAEIFFLFCGRVYWDSWKLSSISFALCLIWSYTLLGLKHILVLGDWGCWAYTCWNPIVLTWNTFWSPNAEKSYFCLADVCIQTNDWPSVYLLDCVIWSPKVLG